MHPGLPYFSDLPIYMFKYQNYAHCVSKVCVFCSQSGYENPVASDILNKA